MLRILFSKSLLNLQLNMNCIILMCLLGAAVAVPLEHGQILEKNLLSTQTVGERVPVVYELPKTGLVSRQTLTQQPINQGVFRVQYPYEQIYQTPEQVYSEKEGIRNVQLVGQNRYEVQPLVRGGYVQTQPIYKYINGVEGLSTLYQGGVQQPIYRYTPTVESTQYQPIYKYEGLNQRVGVQNQPIYTHDEGLTQYGRVGVQQPIYRTEFEGLNQYNLGVQQQPIYRYTNEVEGLTHLNGGVQQPIYGYNKEAGVTPLYRGGYVQNQPIHRTQTSNVFDVTGYKTGPIYEQGTGYTTHH